MSEKFSRRELQAFGMAVALELLILVSAVFALTNSQSVKSAQSGSSLIILANEEPPPVKPPEPKPPLPQPKPLLQPQIAPEPPKPEIPPIAEVNAFTEPAPPPAPPPPPETAAAKAEASAEYAAKVRAAVQAAHHYPAAAAALRYSGRVRVEFHLQDAASSKWRVVVASRIGIIDQAALQAVQNANFPEPPPELKGTDHVFQVWVEFNRS